MNCNAIALSLLLAVVSMTTTAAAQTAPRSVTVRGAPSCGTCTIELTKIATIGKADDPVLLLNYSEVERGPRNSLIVVNSIGNSPSVLVFDSAGRYLRQIGRTGEGPGEFSGWAWYLGMGPGDSLYFRDRGNRYHVFSPSFDFGRQINYSDFNVYPLLALPNGSFVVRTYPRRGQPYTHPAQLISPEGALIRAFGFITPEESDVTPPLSGRFYALNRARDRILVARRNQYDIQRFTLNGERDLILKVENSPWMIPWLQDPTSPFTEVDDLRDAGQGRIWVIGRTPAVGAARFTRANTASWGIRREETLSTVIEIIDVERGTLIASRKFEREMYFFVDHDHVVRQKQDAAGIISFDLFRIALKQ